MSAFLHRLIARDQSLDAPTLAPVVRSRSPIAEIDQRLAVDEGLGHGFDGLETRAHELAPPELDRSEFEPARTTSPLAPTHEPTPPPITVPTPASDRATTIHRKQATALAEPASQAPTDPTPTARVPRLDPGPLFDLAMPAPEFAESRLHAIVHEPTPATALAPEPARRRELPTIESFEPPHDRVEARPNDPLPLPSPWSPLEPMPRPAPAVGRALAVASDVAPLEPSPARERAIPTRVSAPPTTDAAPARAPRSAAPERERRPKTPPPSTAKRATRLDIDSISVIGPLDRHFPNRRWLRLRYR